MRLWGTFFLLMAAAVLAFSSEKHSLEDLKTRAQTARPDEKANLCLEIAERQVNSADDFFRKNQPEQALAALNDVVPYSSQARDAAAITGHRLKNTEIGIRRMIHKLGDMKRQLAFDDQASVQSTIDALEKIRTDLLNRMFKGGK